MLWMGLCPAEKYRGPLPALSCVPPMRIPWTRASLLLFTSRSRVRCVACCRVLLETLPTAEVQVLTPPRPLASVKKPAAAPNKISQSPHAPPRIRHS